MSKATGGTLYGIGVGPGDPDLITVKAVKVLKSVDIIFAAASTKNEHSQAVNIARAHIPARTPVELLHFPMCREPEGQVGAHRANALAIIEHLNTGKSAAFLTLGDPLTYSTFGYVLKQVQLAAPAIPVVSIPGITSYQAAAARINRPLVEGEESLLLVSGVKGGAVYRAFTPQPDNVVFLKTYKNAGDIVRTLEEQGRAASSVGVSRCGLDGEEIIEDICRFKETSPGYWTLIISKKTR